MKQPQSDLWRYEPERIILAKDGDAVDPGGLNMPGKDGGDIDPGGLNYDQPNPENKQVIWFRPSRSFASSWKRRLLEHFIPTPPFD
jgi:hypothetical protein